MFRSPPQSLLTKSLVCRFPCDPDAVFLSDGATPSITRVMQMLLRDGDDAVSGFPLPRVLLLLLCVFSHHIALTMMWDLVRRS